MGKSPHPSADAVTQLFYGLRLLYLEALDLDSKDPHWRHAYAHSPVGFTWHRVYPQWRRLLRRYPIGTGRGRFTPPIGAWPSYVPTPQIPVELDLRVGSLAMASPLEITLTIPPEALVPMGIAGLWQFVAAIEKAWNTKKRIRLEGVELDRKISEEELARDIARERFEYFESGGFTLQDGSVHLPDDWQWPKSQD